MTHSSSMRVQGLLILLQFTPGLLMAEASQRVNVVMEIPLVAQVESPFAIDLAPGETRLVTIRVACNQRWQFSIQADNPEICATDLQSGGAGGTASPGHTFTIALKCSPDADGPQHTNLFTHLISGAQEVPASESSSRRS